jgi:hypothetical protein
MRIAVSLSATRPRLMLPLAAVVWTLGFVLLFAALLLLVLAVETNAEKPMLETRLARLNEQLSAVRSTQTLPVDAELKSMRQRVNAFNAIAGAKGMASAQLLKWLESELPEKAYLVSLHHRPRDGEALMVVEATTAEPLTAFLLRLEKEPRFQEVLLNKQGTRKAPGVAAVQFEIRIKEKP